MVIIGVVYNDPLISIWAFLTGYFEIRTALLYHDIQQLQERVKSLEYKWDCKIPAIESIIVRK